LIGALLLALVGTLTIVAYVRGADARALDGQEVVDVYVVSKSIPAGTPAEQLGDRVKAKSIVKQAVAEGAVTDLETLDGRVTGAALVPGEQLVAARFVDASVYRANGGVDVPKGLLQTTLRLEPERAVGGLLTPGAKVAVTASFDDQDGVEAESRIVLHDVLVTNVQLSENNDRDADARTTSGSDGVELGTAPSGQLLVTLALDAASVERVVFAAERGSLWLSIEPDNANKAGTKIVNRKNVLQ
jgi:pilus assembly protein CpaB